MTTATSSLAAVEALNKLLRGELSATETYQQAMEKIGEGTGAAELRKIHDDHRTAANEFRQHVHHLGGRPDQGSGAWGGFAKAVEGTAKLFGNKAAIKALKEGEEQGIRDYEGALNSSDIPQVCKDGLSGMIAQTRGHVTILDRLLSA
jgi:uncharacterized protein (TIGR02284 family)